MVTPVQTATSNTLTLNINGTVAGNSLVGTITVNGVTGAGSITAISDGTNTYNIVDNTNNTVNGSACGFYALNISGGNLTITFTFSGIYSQNATICNEYSVNDVKSFDLHAVATGTGTALNSGATATVNQSSETVIGWGTTRTTTVPTAGAGFGNLQTLSASSSILAMEDMSIISGGPQTATFGDTTSAAWVCGVMTFKTRGPAYTVVQTPTNHSLAATTCVVTFASTGIGNFLVLQWAIPGTTSPASVIDNKSNSWTSAFSNQDNSGNQNGLYYLPSASNTGGITSVTITFSSAPTAILAQGREYSGLQGAVTVLDKNAHAQSSANPATSGATAATTQPTELIIGQATFISSSANPSWTAGTAFFNYLLVSFDFAGPALIFLAIEDKEVSTTGTQAALFLNPGGAISAINVATFKEGSVAAPAKNGNFLLLGVG